MSIWTILFIAGFVAMMVMHMRGGHAGHGGHGCHGGGHAGPRPDGESHEHGARDAQAHGELAQPPAPSTPPDRELAGAGAGRDGDADHRHCH